ncbi:hypothetical protein HDV02_000958, partial [Globomyces sp. JEL0801]
NVSFVDSEDTMQRSILSATSDSPSQSTSTVATCYPKLDMNLFIPPPELALNNDIKRLSHTLSNVTLSLDRGMPRSQPQDIKRRASESRIPTSHLSWASPSKDDVTAFEDSDTHIEKKGRFTLKLERSSYWTAPKSKGLRTLPSRFEMVPIEQDKVLNTFRLEKENAGHCPENVLKEKSSRERVSSVDSGICILDDVFINKP